MIRENTQEDLCDRMRTLLEEFSRGTETTEQFCKSQGIPEWRFQYWRKKLGYDFRSRRAEKKASSFVRLDISPQSRPPLLQPLRQSYEILLSDGTRLYLPIDFTEDRLTGLLRALRSR
jgi:hypothetical protein